MNRVVSPWFYFKAFIGFMTIKQWFRMDRNVREISQGERFFVRNCFVGDFFRLIMDNHS